jgi:hypothetical protein
MASSREHISTLDFPLRHDNTAARPAIEQPQQFQCVEILPLNPGESVLSHGGTKHETLNLSPFVEDQTGPPPSPLHPFSPWWPWRGRAPRASSARPVRLRAADARAVGTARSRQTPAGCPGCGHGTPAERAGAGRTDPPPDARGPPRARLLSASA